MKLQALSLDHFRGFSHLAMEFRPDCMILTGANDTGKSAILDAAAIALSAYLSGFTGILAQGFAPSDVRLTTAANGETKEAGAVCLQAQLDIFGHSLTWRRVLESGRTLSLDAEELLQYAAALQEHMRRQSPITLPLLAHYGADRSWINREPETLQKVWIKNRQSGYLGCMDTKHDVHLLFSWFENMTYAKQQKLQTLGKKPDASDRGIPELYAVTEAMAECYRSAFPDVKKVRFSFDVVQHDLELIVTGQDDTTQRLPLRLLGRGAKTILLLVADIACRMAILNPQLGADAVQQTPGIVLIDELELHLHPSWQKHILDDLRRIFPQIQFLVSTHSPILLAGADAKCVRVVRGGQVYRASLQTYSKPVDLILSEVMQTDPQPAAVKLAFSSFYESLEAEDMGSAIQKLDWLKEALGDNLPEVRQAAEALARAQGIFT